jgi:hypothetical protein
MRSLAFRQHLLNNTIFRAVPELAALVNAANKNPSQFLEQCATPVTTFFVPKGHFSEPGILPGTFHMPMADFLRAALSEGHWQFETESARANNGDADDVKGVDLPLFARILGDSNPKWASPVQSNYWLSDVKARQATSTHREAEDKFLSVLRGRKLLRLASHTEDGRLQVHDTGRSWRWVWTPNRQLKLSPAPADPSHRAFLDTISVDYGGGAGSQRHSRRLRVRRRAGRHAVSAGVLLAQHPNVSSGGRADGVDRIQSVV